MTIITLLLSILILSIILLPLMRRIIPTVGPIATMFACAGILVAPFATMHMLSYLTQALNNIGNMENIENTSELEWSMPFFYILVILFIISATLWRRTNKTQQLKNTINYNELEKNYENFYKIKENEFKENKKKKKKKKKK